MGNARVQIKSDGYSVWVNNHDGYCLGRFGRRGVDIHQYPELINGKECLYCTHSLTTLDDWEKFKAGMERFHNVVVTDKHKPGYLQKTNKYLLQ